MQILAQEGISYKHSVQLSSVQSLSHVRLFATPWIAARQASLSITNSWSTQGMPKLPVHGPLWEPKPQWENHHTSIINDQ